MNAHELFGVGYLMVISYTPMKVGSEFAASLFRNLGFTVSHEHQVESVNRVINTAVRNHQSCLLVTSVRNPFRQQVSALLQYGVSHTASSINNMSLARNYTTLADMLHKRLALCHCHKSLPHTHISMCAATTKRVRPDNIAYHCNMQFFSESFLRVSGLNIRTLAPQIVKHHYALNITTNTRLQRCSVLVLRLEDAEEWPAIICNLFNHTCLSSGSTHVNPVNNRSSSFWLFQSIKWTRDEVKLLINSDMSSFYSEAERAKFLVHPGILEGAQQ